MPFAARVKDKHTCPLTNPDGSPHTGGPISDPGVATVLIDGQAAAIAGSVCTCAGPPDSIKKGSATVLIGGQPAARMGDTTVHGGVITSGSKSVLIGG